VRSTLIPKANQFFTEIVFGADCRAKVNYKIVKAIGKITGQVNHILLVFQGATVLSVA
jgi:hypothetical protein